MWIMAWLFPREHGAYGQLLFPILAAVASGIPTAQSLLLVVAFLAAFVAHEPLLVLLGQRGPRARREQYEDAVRTLVWAGATAVADAAIAVAFMPPGLRWTVLVPAAFGMAALPMIVKQQQKSTIGELHIVLTLASCALPVGVAAETTAPEAAGCWFVMTLGFWAATLAVRGTIARQRREPTMVLRLAACLLAVAAPFVVVLMSQRFQLHPMLWLAALPLSLAAIVLAAFPPSARRLRVIGWTLVAGGACAAILLAILNHA
jgi:hypothetical protein